MRTAHRSLEANPDPNGAWQPRFAFKAETYAEAAGPSIYKYILHEAVICNPARAAQGVLICLSAKSLIVHSGLVTPASIGGVQRIVL